MRIRDFFTIPTVSAHCDLPCGVYDPAQARIEAESIKAIIKKVADNDDPDFRTRAIVIKEQRSELVKHHLWVLWTDYFKPPHFEKFPELHTLVNEATKLAGVSSASLVIRLSAGWIRSCSTSNSSELRSRSSTTISPSIGPLSTTGKVRPASTVTAPCTSSPVKRRCGGTGILYTSSAVSRNWSGRPAIT